MSKQPKEAYGNLFPWGLYNIPENLEFGKLYRYYFDYILRLLYRIVVFDNVPESINETFLKMTLYTQGKACFFKERGSGELRALNCSRANTPDIYYIPSQILVVNPRLKGQYLLTPGKNCELLYMSETDLYNSDFVGGLYELIRRTATMLADNDLSLNIAQRNTRLVNVLSADTQNVKDSLQEVVKKMYRGDPNIVVKSSLADKLQSVPFMDTSNNQNIIQLIQLQQYILAHFYEIIGLSTHDQLKKERLLTAEINDNIELALYNINDIIATFESCLERINNMFGTEISVSLNPLLIAQAEDPERIAAAAGDLPDNPPEPDPEPDP